MIARLFVLGRSQSFKVTALLVALTGMSSVFAVLSARWMGPSDRGVVVLAATAGTLLMIIGSAGVATGGRMLLSQNDPRYSLGRSFRVARIFGLSQVVLVVAVGWPLLGLSDGWRGPWAGVAFVVYGAALVALYVLREAVHGVGRHSESTVSDLLMAAVQTIGIVALFLADLLTVTSVLWLMAGSAVVQVAYLTILAAGRGGSRNVSVGMPVKELVVLSAPALMATLCLSFVIRGDRLLLGGLADSGSVGIYGTAATFTEATWLVAMGLGQVAFRHAGQGRTLRVAALRRVSFLLSLGVVAVLGAAARPVVSILLGPDYRAAVPLIWILLTGSVFMCVFLFETAVLNGAGDLKGPARAGAVGAGLVVVGCLVLVPPFGATGAAWASVVAYAAMAMVAGFRTSSLHRRTSG